MTEFVIHDPSNPSNEAGLATVCIAQKMLTEGVKSVESWQAHLAYSFAYEKMCHHWGEEQQHFWNKLRKILKCQSDETLQDRLKEMSLDWTFKYEWEK